MKRRLKSQLLLLFLLFTCGLHAQVENLTSEQLITAQKQGVVVIDIRTPKEWQEFGTIPDAHKIMFFDENRMPVIDEFMSEFDKIISYKDQPFILVCRTGSRTGVAGKFLNEQKGYTHVSHLEKGMKQWLNEKREVDNSKSH